MISFLEIGEYISLLEILVNIIIIIFITNFIQTKETTSRTLKDYFINELDKVILHYANLFNCLEKEIVPRDVINEFTNSVSKLNNILTLIEKQYKLDYLFIINYIILLQRIVEDDENFSANYLDNKKTILHDDTVENIQKIRYDTFEKSIYELIIKVNNKRSPILNFKNYESL